MNNDSTIDIGGQETHFDIPDGGVVTGVVVIASYQLFDAGEVMSGTTWGTSAIPTSQAIGMIRQAQISAESNGNNE